MTELTSGFLHPYGDHLERAKPGYVTVLVLTADKRYAYRSVAVEALDSCDDILVGAAVRELYDATRSSSPESAGGHVEANDGVGSA